MGSGREKRGTDIDSGMPRRVLYNYHYPDRLDAKPFKLPRHHIDLISS